MADPLEICSAVPEFRRCERVYQLLNMFKQNLASEKDGMSIITNLKFWYLEKVPS